MYWHNEGLYMLGSNPTLTVTCILYQLVIEKKKVLFTVLTDPILDCPRCGCQHEWLSVSL